MDEDIRKYISDDDDDETAKQEFNTPGFAAPQLLLEGRFYDGIRY